GVLTGRKLDRHERYTECLRGRPNVLAPRALPILLLLAAEVGDSRHSGQRLSKDLQPLPLDLRPNDKHEPRDVAAGTREALNKPRAHRILGGGHDDRDGRGYGHSCPRYQVAGRHDDVRFEAGELGDDISESLEPSLSRPALQDEIPPLYIAEAPQALHECSDGGGDRLRSRPLRDPRRGGNASAPMSWGSAHTPDWRRPAN